MKLNELSGITDQLPKTDKMPAFFIGHGSPTNAIEDNPFTQSLTALGKSLSKYELPKAILVVSAHWLTKGTFVDVSANPKTIHDFGGFQKELYEIQYPSPGSPEMAKEAAKLLEVAHESTDWGLDHGTWTLLKYIYPKADIPVFQVSIDYNKPMSYHLELAKKLAELRSKGVIILGSGNVVHNLRYSIGQMQMGKSAPADWALEFDKYVRQAVCDYDTDALVNYSKAGSSSQLAVPTPDHYIPLLYTMGVGDKSENMDIFYEQVEFGGISMQSFQIG
ncbi:MAG: 4,5-DOPA dioxygenase extradiol [Bacteroidetes bacterium]|nr:4,5-DOPA dioxygenase extradiol [Bacteroidota bacterium]